MKIRWTTLAVLLLAVMAWSAPGRAGLPERYRLADLKALQEAFVEIAEQVAPSVVAIRTYYVHEPREGEASPVRVPRD